MTSSIAFTAKAKPGECLTPNAVTLSLYRLQCVHVESVCVRFLSWSPRSQVSVLALFSVTLDYFSSQLGNIKLTSLYMLSHSTIFSRILMTDVSLVLDQNVSTLRKATYTFRAEKNID